MYARLYNRLCGWLFCTLGFVGLFVPDLGGYIRLTGQESLVCICVGFVGMWGARGRYRTAALVALLLGVSLFFWALCGFAWPASFMGTTEPLENAIRLVAGAWGMYTSVQDVLMWRRHVMAEPE